MKYAHVPLVVIVGQTASGKSTVAVDLARRCNGEIICADSRTIYSGMDIGTAKPSLYDRSAIPHHMLDLVNPDQSFSAADFQRHALGLIDSIYERGKVPIMVGGSGLYIDSVVYDFDFRGPADIALRRRLESLSIEELQNILRVKGIALPKNEKNPRHLIRSIEANGKVSESNGLRPNTVVYGIALDTQELGSRIDQRVRTMMLQGLESEVAALARKYGWQAPGMQSIGYREWRQYFDGSLDSAETEELIRIATRRYAKRQRIWFKRNQSIQWYSDPSHCLEDIAAYLNKTT